MNFTSAIRYMQGERRGMGSELREPTPTEKSLAVILYPESVWAQPISIQRSVGLADVSFWQETIDFSVMKAAGLYGVIIRAGQRNWEDLQFKTNWRLAKAAGIPRGSYWFYDSRDTPANQARLWASLLEGDRGELLHACDFEESYGGAYGTKGHFKEFINRFQDETGLPDSRIANYTGYYWWLERVGDDIFFRRYALWLAWYAAMQFVKVPPPWHESELLLWQYTSSGNGTAYGVSSREIDLNWYCCDQAAYEKQFNLGTVPPEDGETISQWYRVNTAGLNIRSGAGAGNTDIGDLYLNDRIEVEGSPVSGWGHIVRVLRVGATVPVTQDGWCSLAYCVAIAPPVIEPPTEPPVVTFPPEIGVTIGGVTKPYVPKP